MDQITKQILNPLRCPICGGLIDMGSLSCYVLPLPKIGNYHCVNNSLHYIIYISTFPSPIRLEYEALTFIDKKLLYSVWQYYYKNGNQYNETGISVRKIDPEGRILDDHHRRDFLYDHNLFDFQALSGEQILNKIRTILTFQ